MSIEVGSQSGSFKMHKKKIWSHSRNALYISYHAYTCILDMRVNVVAAALLAVNLFDVSASASWHGVCLNQNKAEQFDPPSCSLPTSFFRNHAPFFRFECRPWLLSSLILVVVLILLIWVRVRDQGLLLPST